MFYIAGLTSPFSDQPKKFAFLPPIPPHTLRPARFLQRSVSAKSLALAKEIFLCIVTLLLLSPLPHLLFFYFRFQFLKRVKGEETERMMEGLTTFLNRQQFFLLGLVVHQQSRIHATGPTFADFFRVLCSIRQFFYSHSSCPMGWVQIWKRGGAGFFKGLTNPWGHSGFSSKQASQQTGGLVGLEGLSPSLDFAQQVQHSPVSFAY